MLPPLPSPAAATSPPSLLLRDLPPAVHLHDIAFGGHPLRSTILPSPPRPQPRTPSLLLLHRALASTASARRQGHCLSAIDLLHRPALRQSSPKTNLAPLLPRDLQADVPSLQFALSDQPQRFCYVAPRSNVTFFLGFFGVFCVSVSLQLFVL